MVLDRDHPSIAGFDRVANSFDIHAVDKWIVDHRGGDPLSCELLSGFDGFVQERAATNEHHVTAAVEDLRFAPFVLRPFDPGHWIVFASHKEEIAFAIFSAAPIL